MHSRLTISGMMAVVVFAAVAFAAMRSGSDPWFRLIYSLAALALLIATIFARYRGAFCYGFAVFGWGYFLLGLGPWVGLASMLTPANPPLNRMLLSYDLANYLCSFNPDYQPEGGLNNLAVMLSRNMQAICHSALTLPFGFTGGFIAWLIAPKRSSDREAAEL